MTLSDLPGRNLEPDELAVLVDDLAADAGPWFDEVAFDDQARVFVSLHRDDFVDIWLLCWTSLNDTGWHDHDISSGAVRVVSGSLAESNPRIGGEPAARVRQAGETFCFGPDYIHRLSGAEDRAISIHAYSPPLWRLGQYSIAADGVLRRQSISYAEELRPVEVPITGSGGAATIEAAT